MMYSIEQPTAQALIDAAELFTGGTSRIDESTVRRSHDEDVVHFYTGSHSVARRILRRLTARPDDVLRFSVHQARAAGDAWKVDGLSVTVKLPAVRDFSLMVKVPKRAGGVSDD